MNTHILITCEHGGNHIPHPYQALFKTYQKTLNSHQGYDKGALTTAQQLAHTLQAPFFYSTVSRLLVDLNRSPHNPALFTHPTLKQSPALQKKILHTHYTPHRSHIETHIQKTTLPVLHIAIHSFTPVLNNRIRTTDIGILYDPQRPFEKMWATHLQKHFHTHAPNLRCKKNNPYKGTSDGLTTHLRTLFSNKKYAGIEIEINQALMKHTKEWKKTQEALVGLLKDATSRATLAR